MSAATQLPPEPCPGCARSAALRVTPHDAARVLADYLRRHPATRVATDEVVARRLAQCRACPALDFNGTTCRHCGCLVAVRTKLADSDCPAVPPRWLAQARSG